MLAGDFNFYRFVGNNTTNSDDPFGLKVTIKGNANYVLKMLDVYEKVRKTKKGGELCKLAEESPKELNIIEKENRSRYDPNENEIQIDLTFHPEVWTTEGLQPASSESMLGHELGHSTGTQDEWENMLYNENPIRREIAEPDRTRYYAPQ